MLKLDHGPLWFPVPLTRMLIGQRVRQAYFGYLLHVQQSDNNFTSDCMSFVKPQLTTFVGVH